MDIMLNAEKIAGTGPPVPPDAAAYVVIYQVCVLYCVSLLLLAKVALLKTYSLID